MCLRQNPSNQDICYVLEHTSVSVSLQSSSDSFNKYILYTYIISLNIICLQTRKPYELRIVNKYK